MIILVPLIVLLVRFVGFRKLQPEDLPNLDAPDIQQMKRFSRIALTVIAVFSVASLFPYFLPALFEIADRTALIIWILGICIAAVFDFRAELLKRKGLGSPENTPLSKPEEKGQEGPGPNGTKIGEVALR
ncbi:MAG: hypothetical protein WBG92_02010 [Thiohalocapsa sp.]